jgi:plasmid rolling circle replication initiator protein Rep
VDNKKNHKSSQQESFFKPLNDFKENGKNSPWDRVKSQSMAVSRSYSFTPDLAHFREKIEKCGTWLEFGECEEISHGRALQQAYFCKARGCIMCQWRKSLVIQQQLMDLVKQHRLEYTTDVPLLLTLTILNETGEYLSKAINRMNGGWKRLIELKAVKRVARSWFRSLEITYNADREDYHPHFHALLMVPKNYFYKKAGMYIIRDEWLRLWQQSMRDDRITQVDIRPLKCGTEAELIASVEEVAKYMTKPSSYIFEDDDGRKEANSKVVKELHYATRGRRLIGFGGYFNKIRKAKKMVDVERANLVDVEGVGLEASCQCKVCKKELIKRIYHWYEESNRYLRRVHKKQTEGKTKDFTVRQELDAEIKIQEKPKVEKKQRPSMLLETLRRGLQERRRKEGSGTYGSNGERVQCRGPT